MMQTKVISAMQTTNLSRYLKVHRRFSLMTWPIHVEDLFEKMSFVFLTSTYSQPIAIIFDVKYLTLLIISSQMLACEEESMVTQHTGCGYLHVRIVTEGMTEMELCAAPSPSFLLWRCVAMRRLRTWNVSYEKAVLSNNNRKRLVNEARSITGTRTFFP